VLVITDFVNIIDSGSILVIMLIDVFVRITIMKIKYTLTTLLVEYSTFRIYNMTFLCIIFVLQPNS